MPILPVPDWETLYGTLLVELLSRVRLSRITLGSICSYPQALRLAEQKLGGNNLISTQIERRHGRETDGRIRFSARLRERMYRDRSMNPRASLGGCLGVDEAGCARLLAENSLPHGRGHEVSRRAHDPRFFLLRAGEIDESPGFDRGSLWIAAILHHDGDAPVVAEDEGPSAAIAPITVEVGQTNPSARAAERVDELFGVHGYSFVAGAVRSLRAEPRVAVVSKVRVHHKCVAGRHTRWIWTFAKCGVGPIWGSKKGVLTFLLLHGLVQENHRMLR